jgi:polyhydroxybutyrate depolymerase
MSKAAQDIDDVAFIEHVVDYMISALNIDPNRVYMTGYSRGGMMSYRLGCLLPDKVAAIASVASPFPTYQEPDCNDAPPVPVMLIQGTYDEVVPWAGVEGYHSAGSTIEWWVNHNQCQEVADITEEFDADPDDPIHVRRETFNQCAEGSEVTIYGALGGGHTWPGHRFQAAIDLGATSMDIDATQVIWEFFQRHTVTVTS